MILKVCLNFWKYNLKQISSAEDRNYDKQLLKKKAKPKVRLSRNDL